MTRFSNREMSTVDRLEGYEGVTTVNMNYAEKTSEQFWVKAGRKEMAVRIIVTEDMELVLVESEDCSMDAPVVKVTDKVMLEVCSYGERVAAYFLDLTKQDNTVALAGDTHAEDLILFDCHIEMTTPMGEVEFIGIRGTDRLSVLNDNGYANAYVKINGRSYRALLVGRPYALRNTEEHIIAGRGTVDGRCHRGIVIKVAEIKTR